MENSAKSRALIFIVAYYAEETVLEVLNRIPELPGYDVEVLLIDDGSRDGTFDRADRLRRDGYRYPLTVLANPVNQGYGGNQKLGYQYAIDHGFDIVVLLHGDAQYAPEALPDFLGPLARGQADVVLGSRMLEPGAARRGGMPLYKFFGNRVLTWYQNLVLGSQLSEFHTGYKAYSVELLRRIPFELNSNVFHFDTELIIQFMLARARLLEIPIPTHYGREVCRVNGLRYSIDVVVASTLARLQRYGLVYRRNFDLSSPNKARREYESKLDFHSPHSVAVAETPPASTVMTLGNLPNEVPAALRKKGCRVIGIDRVPPPAPLAFDDFIVTDLDRAPFPQPLDGVQTLLLLDIVEHLESPERFCTELRQHAQASRDVRIVISTANIGFLVTRFMLLLGQFNYNRRGILDLTHTRLFTFASLRRLLHETGFTVEKERGIPAPIPFVIKRRFWSGVLMRLQRLAIRTVPGLFSYQILVIARPLPTLDTLLKDAQRNAAKRATGEPVKS